MSFAFTPLRLLILAACLATFYFLGGLTPPKVGSDGYQSPAKVRSAWVRCTAMFVVGAVSVSLVDHRVGLFEPTNLRILYVILGLVLMGGSVLWLNALRQAVAGP